MKIKPCGDYLFVRKTISGKEEEYNGQKFFWRGNIVVSSATADNTNFCEILAVGPKCKYFDVDCIGSFIICPEISNDLHRITGEDFAIRERAVDVLATFD